MTVTLGSERHWMLCLSFSRWVEYNHTILNFSPFYLPLYFCFKYPRGKMIKATKALSPIDINSTRYRLSVEFWHLYFYTKSVNSCPLYFSLHFCLKYSRGMMIKATKVLSPIDVYSALYCINTAVPHSHFHTKSVNFKSPLPVFTFLLDIFKTPWRSLWDTLRRNNFSHKIK